MILTITNKKSGQCPLFLCIVDSRQLFAIPSMSSMLTPVVE